MAWTAPATAVAGTVLTAADWNTYVRDNSNETGPAKATASGRLLVTTGPNQIAERVVTRAVVSTAETTTSTSYTALATAGPAVTVTTGTRALVMITAQMSNNTAAGRCHASIDVSGASTIAASDLVAVMAESGSAGEGHRLSSATLFTTLTSGSNTFTAQYRVTAGTGTFANREIAVVAL